MAIEVNDKVKATLLDGSNYIGTLTDICLEMDKDNPTQASIILRDDVASEETYGNVHIWCNGLKNIEIIKANSETEE